MSKVLTLPFFLIFLNSFAQTDIQKAEFKLSYKFSCFYYNYDITTPLLQTEKENDIRKIVNDSISSIANDLKKIEDPHYIDSSDCPTMYIGAEEFNTNYKVTRNTDNLLSIILNTGRGGGNGGHGGGKYSYCFNLDIAHNHIITMDSLFNPENKISLCKYIKPKSKKLFEGDSIFAQSFFDVDCEYIFNAFENGSITFLGMSIDSSFLTLHYSYYMGHGYTDMTEIDLPFKEIKNYIDKRFWWICPVDKKP